MPKYRVRLDKVIGNHACIGHGGHSQVFIHTKQNTARPASKDMFSCTDYSYIFKSALQSAFPCLYNKNAQTFCSKQIY